MLIREAFDEDEEDGWFDIVDKPDDLDDVLSDLNNLKYELDNCVKGGYTGVTNYKELGEYIIELSERLYDVGDIIKHY